MGIKFPCLNTVDTRAPEDRRWFKNDPPGFLCAVAAIRVLVETPPKTLAKGAGVTASIIGLAAILLIAFIFRSDIKAAFQARPVLCTLITVAVVGTPLSLFALNKLRIRNQENSR